MRTLTRLLFLVGLLGCGGVDDSETSSADGGVTPGATCHHADARCSQRCASCH